MIDRVAPPPPVHLPKAGWTYEPLLPAVLSVRPPFAAMLLDGRKTVELRRRGGLDLAGRLAVVYETAPVSAAVGRVRFGCAFQALPARVWEDLRARGGRLVGMSRAEYDAWCEGLLRVTALDVLAAERLPAVPLPALREAGFRAPRSWRVLEWRERELLGKRWGLR